METNLNTPAESLVKEDRLIIYTGRQSDDGKQREYLLLPKDAVNDGRRAVGTNCWYAILWPGNAGSMYEIKSSKYGETINYNIKSRPVGIWQNADQRVQWQASQRAHEDARAAARLGSLDAIIMQLAPFRREYEKLKTRPQRAALLARMITYVTS